MTRFGIKLAQETGFKKAYKDLRKLAKEKDYELIFFEDASTDDEVIFYTIELLKYSELEYIGYSLYIDEVIREAEDFLMGKEE